MCGSSYADNAMAYDVICSFANATIEMCTEEPRGSHTVSLDKNTGLFLQKWFNLITVFLFKQGVTFPINRQNTIEVKSTVFVAVLIARKFLGNFH